MDVRFSQASNAYQDALRTAERILARVNNSDTAESIGAPEGDSFFDMVGQSLKTAEASGYRSENMTAKAMSGKADLTDVIAAIGRAESSLNTVVAIRDRVINAYQDIIRMPI